MVNYWLVNHSLNAYMTHTDKIQSRPTTKKRDKVFGQIEKGDRVIYYIRNYETIGIFEVSSERYPYQWRRGEEEEDTYDIKPVYIAPYFFKIDPYKYGFKSLRGRTAIQLEHDQYGGIKSEILGMNDPDSESGVVSLFSKVHHYLGFPFIKAIGSKFPDCIALDEQNREVKIEFKEKSSSFNYSPKGCDLIVCWNDDLRGHAPVKAKSLKKFIYGHE